MPSDLEASPVVTISVVIVNWNARAMLDRCLRSLEAQVAVCDQLIVVDNGSTDGSQELVEKHHPKARLVALDANRGFAEGCNRGIALAGCEWVLTLNNDAELTSGCLDTLRTVAAGCGSEVGMLQPRIVFTDRPAIANSTGLQVISTGEASDRDFDVPARPDDVFEEIFCPTATAALYRRRMLDSIRLATGVLDDTYFMYFEDADLGWRARLAGWSAFYVPEATVRHAFQGSSPRHGPAFVEVQCYLNRLRTVLKNASVPFLLRSLPTTLAHCRRVVRRNGRAGALGLARAVWDGLRQRQSVHALSSTSQRDVERRWLAPSGDCSCNASRGGNPAGANGGRSPAGRG